MKKSILALSALMLALGAGLSACGGGKSTYTVGGTVLNLTHGPLVLVSNGMETAPLKPAKPGTPENIAYTFPNELEYGETYDVKVKGELPYEICEPAGGTADTAGRLTSINANISCRLRTFALGGKVIGLTGTGLELSNGSTVPKLAITPKADGGEVDFAFPEVAYDYTYGVTVLTPPTGQTCTVTGGTGTMKTEAVTSIRVNCVDNPRPAG